MCWDYNGLVGLTIEKVVGLSEGLFTPAAYDNPGHS